METIDFTTKETRLVKIEPAQLEAVIENSGLQISEGEEIKKSYLPFLTQLSETQSQSSKINFENPSGLDENIARELRLRTVKIRTSAEKLKDERKKMYLLRSNLEQASFNIIAASCKLTEEVFFNVEKAHEIAEKKRKEQLKTDREAQLSFYTEVANMYPLGEMSEEQFNDLYSGLRIAHENKIAAEKKAEEERIAKEKAEAEENERIRFENEKLQKEAEERKKQITDEKEKIKKESEEKDRLAEIERKKQAQILADIQAKAEVEHEEKERLAAEIKAKEDADKKAKDAEERHKKAVEKKARLAPDKIKLLKFMQEINDLPRPEVKSIEAADIASKVNIMLVRAANYIKDNADKL